MASLNSEETLFYRNLYSIFNDPHISTLLEKYAKLEYNKALSKVRSKNDAYDSGYFNGKADAWEHLLTLKQTITDIIKR